MTGFHFEARERLRRLSPIIVALVALLVYANALANGFVLDDGGIVRTNPLVHHVSGLWRAFANPYWPGGSGTYRPLPLVTYTLDWLLSGGDARWLHAMNLAWNALAAVAVWVLAAELLAPAAALLSALLFAVHPVHVEAVANIVGRAECMVTVFIVAALVAHRRGRWFTPIIFALALLSKEMGIAFVAIAAAGDLMLASSPRAMFRARRTLYAAYGGVIALYAVAVWLVFRGMEYTFVAPFWQGMTVSRRWLTVASVVPEYVRLLVMPLQLSADYAPRTVMAASGFSASIVVGVLLLLALVALLPAVWRRDRRAAFALVWVVAAIAPVANILVPTGIILAERTLYLATVGVVLGVGVMIEAVGVRRLRPVMLSLAGVGLVFVARTWTRTPAWRSNGAMVARLLADHPESYHAHQYAGRLFLAKQDLVRAQDEFALAVRLFDRDASVYQDLAQVTSMRGDDRAADTLLARAIAADTRYATAHLARAAARYRLGDHRGAYDAARRAFAIDPTLVQAKVVEGAALEAMGDTAGAERAYRAGIARDPREWRLRAALGRILLARSDTVSARSEATVAVALSNGNAQSRELLARTTSPR